MYGYRATSGSRPGRARRDRATGYWEQNGYDADTWLGSSNGFSLDPSLPDATLKGFAPVARIKRVTVPERALLDARVGVLRTAHDRDDSYLPTLSTLISRRHLVKNVHLWVAVAWAVALVVILDRRQPQATRRGLARDRDDRPGRPPLAPRAEGAAGTLQRRSEDQRAPDDRFRAALCALRILPLAR